MTTPVQSVNRWDKYQDSVILPTLNRPQGENNRWDRYRDDVLFGNQQVPDDLEVATGPGAGFIAGILRGLTEPLTIIPAVNRVAENLKPFYGDNWTSKVPYGIGFIAGTLLPGALAFRVGGAAARGLGLVTKLKTADKVADLSRAGKLTRGAVTGALYGAGIHADNVQEYATRVVTLGAMGSAGEIVIPKALAAISARFGKNVNPSILQLVEEEAAEVAARTVSTGTRKGVALHARAMQLVDDMDDLFYTSDQRQYYQALKNRGIEGPEGALAPISGRRLAMDLAVQELDLTNMVPGQYRIVPTPHQDANIFRQILQRTDELSFETIKRADTGESVVIGLTEGFDRKVAKELQEFGFLRGQEAIYKGAKWIVVRPTKKGDGVWLAKMGRNKKPLAAKTKDVALLPIAHDISTPSLARIQPLVAEFIDQNTLWPGELGFNDAVNAFANQRAMNTSERLAFRRDLIKKQRSALGKEDPAFGKVLDNLDEAAEQVNKVPHPDGPLEELAAARGVVVRQHWEDGGWKHIASGGDGQPLSPLLNSEEEMMTWLRNYQIEPPDLAPRGMNLAEEVVPGSGTPSMPAHTAIDHSNAHLNPALTLTSSLLPRAKFLQFAEDTLRKLGIDDVKPFTEVFLPLATNRKRYLNEMTIWLKGGTLDDGTSVRGLIQIYNPKKPTIRATHKEAIVDLLESPRNQWGAIARDRGLNEQELKAASGMRDWFNRMFVRHVNDENITITADDFIENYWPHYRRLSDAEAPGSISTMFAKVFPGKKLNKPTTKFLSEMQRQGIMSKYDKDPFNVMLKYLRAGLYKTHMKETIDSTITAINKMPQTTKDLQLIRRSLIDYVQLARYGAPEAFTSVNAAVDNTLRMLNLPVDLTTQERIVNTYLTLNYGAYLGFRPGLALRNLYQTILTGMPILGPKYLAHGIKTVFSNRKEAFTSARKAGALLTDHVPVFGDDLLYAEYHAANLDASGKVGALEKFRRLSAKVTNLGMRLYTSADTINRGVVFHGMRKRVLDAWNKYGSKGEIELFHRKSGMNFFGPSIKDEFMKQLRSGGAENAFDWIGARAAEDTQWIYQLGAGPSLFSHGVGRLFGQYGTWPSWYSAYLAQGVKNLDGVERAMFLASNVAVHKTIIMAGALAGWNMSRWTGISSLTWMGGPAVDWFSDFREIATGVTTSGETTAGRAIALSKVGVKDVGGDGAALLPSALGGRLQFKEDPADRLRFATYFLGSVTPGYIFFARDLPQAVEQAGEGDLLGTIGRMMSIPLDSPGYEYPQVNLGGR